MTHLQKVYEAVLDVTYDILLKQRKSDKKRIEQIVAEDSSEKENELLVVINDLKSVLSQIVQALDGLK